MDHPSHRVIARYVPTPLYKASIKVLAQGQQSTTKNSTSNVDDIITKIRNCLNRGEHRATTEHEAKTALYMASKLMAQHNLTRADIIASYPESRSHAGQSEVLIRHYNIHHASDLSKTTPVKKQGFLHPLMTAISMFFKCRYYSRRGASSVYCIFYGIAENTIAAAYAFESTYNLIAEWARSRRGTAAQASYCLGIAKGLKILAENAEYAEEELLQSGTMKSRAGDAQKKRMGPAETTEYEDELGLHNEVEDSNLDVILDLNKGIDEAGSVKWYSYKQLVLFRQNADKIAEDHIAKQDIHLRPHSGRPTTILDQEAYEEGRKDARYIDFGGNTITEQ